MSLENIITDWGGVEVAAMDVYSDIFRLGENEIQMCGEEKGAYKANPIGYWKTGAAKGHYRIMFDDTFEQTLQELQEADFAILNGITYFGRKNVQAHASKMYAMIFDIDGVTDKTLNAFLNGAYMVDAYPVPNYIALSGHGVHFYYVMEYGVPLYPNIKLQLKAFKYALTDRLWNAYTSTDKKKQFQGINQGFRVIGGKTKIDGVRVRAFRMHQHPFNLEQLGRYVREEHKVDESKLWRESRLTLVQAAEKYPEWYSTRILKKRERGRWTCKKALYEWWKGEIQKGATYHHRYFAVMCLAIYGVKCGLTFEEVKADAFNLIPFLNSINPAEPFTENDCLSALECFDERYVRFPRNDIAMLSGIPIEKNKRNGRKQKDHIVVMNKMKEVKKLLGEDVNEGRPAGSGTAELQVRAWQQSHPDGTKAACIRETGLSKPTVYKWWNKGILEKPESI